MERSRRSRNRTGRSRKISTTGKNPHASSFLSIEIISAILSRIAAETILRFRRVSKAWDNLITSSNFISAHLAHQRQICRASFIFKTPSTNMRTLETEIQQNLLINLQDDRFRLKEYDLCLDHYPIPHDNMLLQFSCDGLLLLQNQFSREKLYICNPVTRQTTFLILSPPESTSQHIKWALIHDASVKKYKVVGFSCLRQDSYCLVYTLPYHGKNRRVLNLEASDLRPRPISANNELHWLAKKSNGEYHMVSLDIANEEFRYIEGPPYRCRTPQLLELKGTFYFVEQTSVSQIDIWVLNDGINWTMKYRIDLPNDLCTRSITIPLEACDGGDPFWSWLPSFYPLTIIENYCSSPIILLITCHYQLFCYDLKKQTFGRMRLSELNRERLRHSFFVEHYFIHYSISSLVRLDDEDI